MYGTILTPFHVTGQFLYPLKISENLSHYFSKHYLLPLKAVFEKLKPKLKTLWRLKKHFAVLNSNIYYLNYYWEAFTQTIVIINGKFPRFMTVCKLKWFQKTLANIYQETRTIHYSKKKKNRERTEKLTSR